MWTASSAWKWALTTTCPSRSTRVNCWPASTPCCAAAPRSPQRQAVDARHRQRDGAAAQDRRQSAEDRQQLREQFRRASIRLDGETQLRNTHLGQR